MQFSVHLTEINFNPISLGLGNTTCILYLTGPLLPWLCLLPGNAGLPEASDWGRFSGWVLTELKLPVTPGNPRQECRM